MVAIFTGYGAGVERGSTNILGGAGQLGGASHGRGGENVSVNAATGGLIISRRDEFLTGVGPDASVSRSYNSLVHTGDRDNGDNWQQSTTRRVFGLVGGVNSSGSTVQRLGADGSVINYEYATRDGEAAYWAIDGAGTHDKLEFDAGTDTWTWTDGDSLVQETYTLAYNQTAGHDPAVDGAGEFRLFGLEDRSGQKLTYSYEANSDRLHRITTENDNSISTDNEWIEYQWNADGTIARIDTGYRDLQNGNSDETLTRVYYGYDAQGRLSSVTTDLSPEDQATSDGNVYTISYEYVDTASNLISKISQADGSELAITYNADGRIATLTQKVDATDASQDRVTSLAYHIGYTIVTAPDGTDTRLDYDAGGRLLQITTTAPGAGALSQIRQFEYDAEGNVTKVIETEGDASLLATTAATGGLDVEEVAVSTGDTGASGSSGTSSNDAAFAATGRGSNLSVVSLPEDLSEAPADGTLPEGWGGWNTVETNWKVVDAPYSASGTNDSLALNLTNLNGDTHSGRAEFAAPISLDSTKHHEYTFYFQHNSDAALRLNVRPDPYATDAQGNLVPTFKNAASGNLTVHQNMVDLYFNHANKPPVAQNKWYKAVVYILADGTPLLGSSKRGGIYDIETGAKLTDVNSLIWDENRVSDTASMRFRFSGLVGSDPAEGIKIWRPEIREVDPSAVLVDDATLDVAVDAQLNGPPPPPVTYEGTGRGSNLSVVSLPEDLSEAPADGTLPEGWGGWNTVETNWKVVDAPYSASGTNDSLALNLTNLNGDTHSGRAEFAAPISLDSTKHHEYTFYFQHNSDAALRLNVRPDPYATDAQGNLVPTFKNAASGNLTVHQNMVDLYFNHANKPPVAQNKWYKAVVYILADGTPLLGSSKRGGIYDIETGAKLTDVNSLIWDENRVSDTASMRFRFGGLVGSDPAEGIKIWRPEIREVDPSAVLVDDATLDVAVDAELNGIGGGAPSGGGSGSSGDPVVTGENVPTGNVTGAPGVLYDVNGRATSYVYDSLGNVTQITDPNGNVVLRSYDANNQLETEQWTGSSASGSNVTSYAHNVYDTAGRLHYSVSAEGRVTEFRYTPAGQLLWTISYPESRYPDASQPVGSSAPTLGEMNAWRDGLDRSSSQMVMSEYDARGNLWRTTNFTSDSNGGVITAGNGGHYLQSYNTYDQAGQLLASYALGEAATVYDYDGLGRVKFSSDSAGNAMSVVFNDAGSETVITSAGGLVTTSTYNLAGELVTSTESSVAPSGTASTVLGIDNYAYDDMGRLAVFTDARGDRTFYIYDDLGRQTAIVTEDGWMTETRYDEANNVIATARYTAKVSATDIAAIATADHTKTVDQIRPASAAPTDISQDIWTWAIYDVANRLVQSINGDGAVTEFEYDAANNLIRSTAYWNKVDVSGFDTNPPETALVVTHNTANDIIVRNFYDRSGRQIGTLDGEGYLTQTVYDEAGRVVAQTAFAGLTTANQRANGSFETLLASPDVVNQGKRTARNVYDGLGLLRYQIDALGHVTGFTYDNAGKITVSTAFTDPISVSGDVLSPSDVEQALPSTPASTNRTVTTDYDSAGRVASVTEPSGLVTSYTYDVYNNVATETRADGSDTRTTRNYYDAKGQLRFALDPEGTSANEYYVSELIYDAEGNVVETRRYDSPITATGSTTGNDVMSYVAGDSAAGRFAKTTTTFGNQGEVVSVSQKLNDTETSTTNTTYTGTGATLRVDEAVGTLDAVGHVHYNDVVGRVTDSLHAHGQAEVIAPRTTYDTLGRVVSERDPELHTTTFEYDSRGLVTKVITPDTNDTEYEYNAFGEVVKVTDPRGNSTITYYDDLGRVTMVIDAEGYVTETSYNTFGEVEQVVRHWGQYLNADPANKPSFVIDSQDHITRFEYDHAGRLNKTIDAEDYVETYSYNAFGERVSMTGKSNTDTKVESAADANITTYEYDKRGLLIRETLPAEVVDENDDNRLVNIVNTYDYDSRGNQISMTEAEGLAEQRTTTYVYDKANRLIETRGQARQVYSQTNHLAVSGLHTPTETISYDARGNITKTVDASGATTVFYYDDLGRKVVEIDALGTYTAYEYDQNSNVERIRIFETQVSIPADAATNDTYVGGSKEEAPNAPAGAARQTLFEYDKLNRMTKSSVILPTNYKTGALTGTLGSPSWNQYTPVTLDTVYDYDANGNVIRTVDPNGNQTFAYYDALGRKTDQVTGVSPHPANDGGYRTQWEYDSEGNVTKETVFANAVTGSVTATAVPSVTVDTENDRVTTYTYDDVGNRLSETRKGVLIHNGSGGTQSVDATVYYEYNGLGQVTKKTEATGDLTEYSYDDGGRLESERRLGDGLTYGFIGHTNTQVTPGVDYSYDGLGNLRWSKAIGGAGVAERYTSYEYNSGGLLERMIDADGKTREYFYDKSGRQILERYYRTESSNQLLLEGSLSRYDLLGRVTEQWTARWNGTGWTSDSDGSARDTSRVAQTEYNAFGDVSRTGINGTWISENKYDLAGRLWASNAGDGIWKYFGYDNNGNQAIAVTSAGEDLSAIASGSFFNIGDFAGSRSISQLDVNATYTEYDARNMAIRVVEEGRQLTGTTDEDLTTTRTYNAFGEVANETDARGATLTYTYNTMGRMIRSESPTVEVLYEDGSSQWIRPAEDFYYDESGRLVAQLDANGSYATGGNSTTGAAKLFDTGNLTRLELLAGTGYSGSQALITRQIAADGGITRTSFDIHGDARKVEMLVDTPQTGDVWRTTNQEYDKLGRLTKVTEPNGLIRHYEYDEVGNRTAEWVEAASWVEYSKRIEINNLYGSSNKQTTDYDKHGQVLRVSAYGGDVTQTTYDWDDTIEAGGTGLVNTGGWIKQTAFANGKTLTETSDVFGRATRKVDLGGNITTYSYDIAGRQTSSQITRLAANGGGSATATYSYLNTGQVWTNTSTANNSIATYDYDASGNRTRERLTQGGVTIKDHTATYDKLGRLTDWNAVATSKAPAASESHDYDANGNIRRTQESFYTLNSTGGQGWLQSGDKWFRFDSMNRVVVQNGERTGGVIRGGTSGLEFTYNIAGERVEQFQTETRYRQEVDPDFDWASWGYEGSNPNDIDYIDVPYDVTIRESYAYNSSGQLTEIWVDEYESNGATAGIPELTVSDVTVNEGGSTTFTIELSSAATSAISVDYATANGTATTADYQSRSGSVTFSAGETTKNITVQTTSDNNIEGSENFFFNLSNASGATITDGSAQATIIDGVVTPAISISNATAAEGNSLAFTVSLSTASNSTVSVNYGTTSGSATTADYVANNGTLTFAAGQTSKTVYVSARTDTINEGNEVMYLDLSGANGATIADSRGNGTIMNVAAATNPVISITGDSGPEGSNATFLVTLSEASTSAITVDFAAFGISAQSGIDFQSSTGTLTFAAGETAKGINVFLYDDSLFEFEETFEVRLANATGGATLHASQNIGFGTIFDMTTGGGGPGDPSGPILPFSLNTSLSPEPSLTSAQEPVQSDDTFTSPSNLSTLAEPVSSGVTFDATASNTVASQSATALSGIRRSLFVYDLLGRQTRQDDFNTSGQSVYSQQQFFNDKGQLIETEVSTKRDDGKTYLQHNRFDYGIGTNYALGNIVQSLSDTRRDNDDGDVPDTATKYLYDWYDSAVQKTIYHDKDYGNSYNDPVAGNGSARGMDQGAILNNFHNNYTTTHYYNQFGQLSSAYVQDGIAKNVSFTLDEAGQIIRRDETVPSNVSQTGSPHEVWYRYGGAEMGYTGNNGTTSVSATKSIAQRTAESPSESRTGTFRGGKDTGSAYIDGAGALTRFNSYSQGSSVGTYTVRGGESLQQIAATTYGDASLWYKIAQANGLSGTEPLASGMNLRLPAGVVRTTHNASTFKPYDPSEAIGELSPTTPKPAKSAKCGVFGQILLAVVAIAVSVVLPGGGTFIGGAINAALGSIASQAVGVATGIQEKFSFKSVGLAAISGGISGGISELSSAAGKAAAKAAEGTGKALNGFQKAAHFLGRSGVTSGIARGVVSSAISQGIGVATGLQSKFSFAGVVAAGVAAGIGDVAGKALGARSLLEINGQSASNIAANVAKGGARLLASAATRSAIEGSSFGRAVEAGLPDVIGQVIGDSFIGSRNTARFNSAVEQIVSFAADEPSQVADTAANSTDAAAAGAGRQIAENSERVSGNAAVSQGGITTGEIAEQEQVDFIDEVDVAISEGNPFLEPTPSNGSSQIVPAYESAPETRTNPAQTDLGYVRDLFLDYYHERIGLEVLRDRGTQLARHLGLESPADFLNYGSSLLEEAGNDTFKLRIARSVLDVWATSDGAGQGFALVSDATTLQIDQINARADRILLQEFGNFLDFYTDVAGTFIAPIGYAKTIHDFATGEINAAEAALELIPGGRLARGFNKVADAARIERAQKRARLQNNRVRGVEFENATIDRIFGGVGLKKNTTTFTETLPNGKVINTIPDVVGRPAGVVEIKDVINLSHSDQLRAQLQLAARRGDPFTLVVSPRNQSISKPLQQAIFRHQRQFGGGAYRFDPATDALSRIKLKP